MEHEARRAAARQQAAAGAIPEAPDRDILPRGASVAGYTIDRLIGRGGFSHVYRAFHPVRGEVAVKVLSREVAVTASVVQRFVQESTIVNLLRHPNIAAIHELGKLDDGRPFSIMELLSGKTLSSLLRERGRLSVNEAIDIMDPIASALDAAHEAGIIHRDLKPSNVAIAELPRGRVVKLLDFGIAKMLAPGASEAGITTGGQCIGTPDSMAPEQVNGGAIDARTDVYALGVMLYQMLTGQAPFLAKGGLELALQHIDAPAPRPSLLAPVSAAIDAVVLRCLEKAPARRYATTGEFMRALCSAAGHAHATALRERGASPVTTGTYVGVFAELRVSSGDDALEFEPRLAADVGRCLDVIERALDRSGFLIPLAAGSALLGVKRLPDREEERDAACQGFVALLTSLHQELSGRPNGDDRVRARLCAHVAPAIVRGAAGREVIEGSVAQLRAWVPSAGEEGVYLTPDAAELCGDGP